MNSPPAWLLAHIRANTRSARLTTCPTCRAPVITGLDDDMAAFTATVEPTHLDPPTEALALLAGRASYDLQAGSGRLELTRRTRSRIRAGIRPHLVVADHRCPRQDQLSLPYEEPT